ncbi:MAG: hypothetical protein AB7E72_14110 [Lysobacterales bacterium]
MQSLQRSGREMTCGGVGQTFLEGRAPARPLLICCDSKAAPQRVAWFAAQRLTGAFSRHRPESAARTSGYKSRRLPEFAKWMTCDIGTWVAVLAHSDSLEGRAPARPLLICCDSKAAPQRGAFQRVAWCAAQRLTGTFSRHRPESAARTSGYKSRRLPEFAKWMTDDIGSWVAVLARCDSLEGRAPARPLLICCDSTSPA